jgi:hypothetical protein
MTNKFENLSEQLSKLLALFEVSAKSFVEKQGLSVSKDDKEFLFKINQIIEQNKMITKNLASMEEKINQSNTESENQFSKPNIIKPKPLPRE